MCPTLLDPLNGNVLWSDLSYNSGATYTCNSGFELVGNELRTCLSDGVWSNEEPVCRGIVNWYHLWNRTVLPWNGIHISYKISTVFLRR